MSELSLYNSLTKKVEPLVPLEPGKIRMYHCGPTVYKRSHIGNMRRFLFADLVRRSSEFLGYEVREITNITDVGHLTQDEIDAGEDKVAKAAQAAKVTPQDIAQRETANYLADIQALNIQPSHKYPRASQHIPQMQALITKLLERGHAYATSTGIYFSVESFPDYGKLSGNTLDKIDPGSRIAVRGEKKHPADFALWIFSTDALQKWDSPWGTGYPGWHIECSAMSLEYLGTNIDIHTGGEDNRFPHHENEIAQSEGATGERFVQIWLHNAFLQLRGEKLAKRGNEQITLDTIKERGFSPLAFRLLIFMAHYRSPLEFTWELLAEAQEQLDIVRTLVRRLVSITPESKAKPDTEVLKQFQAALSDDLNTAQAWALVRAYIKAINSALDASPDSTTIAGTALATLQELDRVLGFVGPLIAKVTNEKVPAEIQELAEAREKARLSRNFTLADDLRLKIEKAGFQLEDTSNGPRLTPN